MFELLSEREHYYLSLSQPLCLPRIPWEVIWVPSLFVEALFYAITFQVLELYKNKKDRLLPSRDSQSNMGVRYVSKELQCSILSMLIEVHREEDF